LVLAGIFGNRICSPQPAQGPTLTSSLGVVSLPSRELSFLHRRSHHYDHDRSDPGGINATSTSTSTSTNDQASVRAWRPRYRPTPRSRPFVSSRSREDAAPDLLAKPDCALTTCPHLHSDNPASRSPLSVLTLNKDGKVNVPTNYSVPGWYTGDQSPGQKGHRRHLATSTISNGPAVFYHLDKLKLGNRVDVTLKTGASDVRRHWRSHVPKTNFRTSSCTGRATTRAPTRDLWRNLRSEDWPLTSPTLVFTALIKS